MAFEADFKSFLPHSITIEPYTGQNSAGEESYGSGIAYSGRVADKTKMIRTDAGIEKVTRTVAWLNTTTAISTRDRVTLPSGFTPNQPPLLRVDRIPDDEGMHHLVLYM